MGRGLLAMSESARENTESSMLDYLRYYDLETYLLEEVRRRFLGEGRLSAFDFFSIVIWKANRAKSKIAHRLLRTAGSDDLDQVVAQLSRSLFEADTPKERLRILMKEWGFLLPMASAVLTVLWPDEFTVYDVRVCDELGDFHRITNRTRFDRIWSEYGDFCEAVRADAPDGLSLREKDRYLWARSAATQLQQEIVGCFGKADKQVGAAAES